MKDVEHAHRRLDDLEIQVNSHAEQINVLVENISETNRSVHENTRITQEVANNTAELVELFKGAKVFRKFLLGVAPVIAVLYAVYAWIKGPS